MLKIVLIGVGTISLGLGCLGIVLPILPATPFFMLTAVCYGKASSKFYNWFLSTKLYKWYLSGFVSNEPLTIRKIITTLIMVTVVISVGMIFAPSWILRVILSVVLAGHYFYFIGRAVRPRSLK